MSMLMSAGRIGVVAMLPFLMQQSAALPVYVGNFEDGTAPGFSGFVSVEGTQGFASLGFGQKFLRNDTPGSPARATTLTLTNLQPHTSVDIGFLLAIIDSWDGLGCCSPDYFTVMLGNGVSSTVIFQQVFDNIHNRLDGFPYFAINNNFREPDHRGFSGGWIDAAYDFTQLPILRNVPHTGSTLTLSFFAGGGDTTNSFQGGLDESWAIDTLSVSLSGTPGAQVPEPATLALLAVGLAGAVWSRRCTKV